MLILDVLLAPFFSRDRCYVKNIHYHHGLTANFDGVMRETIRYRLCTNSLGFKDRARRPVPLKSDKYRIVFLGDSFTEGLYFPYEKTFVGLIDRQLAENSCEVLNAAVVSYCPKIHYLKVKYLIETIGLRFNELVVFADISDIQDEVAYKNFVPDGSFFVSLSYFLYNAVKKHSFIGNLLLTSKTAIHYLKKVESIYYGLDVSGKRTSSAQQDTSYSGGWENWEHYDRERDAWLFDEAAFRRWGREGLELAEKNMDKLHELCRQYAIKLTVAAYPWPSEIRQKRTASRNMHFWQHYCKTRGIDFLNYYPYLWGQEEPEAVIDTYYVKGDIHFNAAGHELLAHIWLEHFRNNPPPRFNKPASLGQAPPHVNLPCP